MSKTLLTVIIGGLMAGCAPPSAWNMPPVIGAARSGNLGELEKLLAAGADPDVHAGVNGWPPLMHAIHKNQEGSVKVLLAHHANVNATGDGGATPLIMAAGYGYANIVRLLLDAGADPKISADNGQNALQAALSGVPDIDRFTVGHCQTETVKVLLASNRTLKLTPGPWTGTGNVIARFAGCSDVMDMLEKRRTGKN